MDENVLGNVVGSLIDRNQNENCWGGGFMWVILLLFLTGGMGGFGWGNRAGNIATTQDVAASQMFGQVDNGIRGLAAGQANIAYDNLKQSADTNMMISGGFANLAQAVNENRFAAQNCCCETNRNIDALRYDTAKQTCDITTVDTANTQKILDAICQLKSEAKDNEIARLRTDLQAAQLTLAQGVQTQTIVSALMPPAPKPAYIVPSPYVGYGTQIV